MGWIIRYARARNDEPIYTAFRDGDPDVGFTENSVKELAKAIARPLRSVRVACAEAREDEQSDYLA